MRKSRTVRLSFSLRQKYMENPTIFHITKIRTLFSARVRIPDGALVIRTWYFVHTVLEGSGTNTAHLKLGFVSDDDEIVEAAVLTTLGTARPHGGITGCFALDGNALTNDAYALAQGATYVHITGDDEIILTTGNSQTVTSGKLSVFVEYVVTGDLS